MIDLDKTDLLTIALLADCVRRRQGRSGMASDEDVAEASDIYRRHLGFRPDPYITLAMIDEARGTSTREP